MNLHAIIEAMAELIVHWKQRALAAEEKLKGDE